VRFPLAVVDRVVSAIGAERTAIRLSPGNPQADMVEADPGPLYRFLVTELDRRNLAYLHLSDNDDFAALAELSPLWHKSLIANVGENREPTSRITAQCALANGYADAVSFGRGFISNPDLPARLISGAEWTPIRRQYLYTPGRLGYTDYPPADSRTDVALQV
jgi:N-ethylmaleimide reductase